MADAPEVGTALLHGHELSYVDVGTGPRTLLLVHGLGGSHDSWRHLLTDLGEGHRVVAPDLFGHGSSSKPVGDYSLGGHAATLRDLLDHLGIDKVTLVGHSLGGGIAMQLAYLFPDRVEGLVLVSSGGLGRDLRLMLRAAVLPGSEWVLPLAASSWVRRPVEGVVARLGRIGLRPGPDAVEMWRGFVSLGDAETRRAFLATSRAVIDVGGQTVSARRHLPSVAGLPTLIVWGARDRTIPLAHGVEAQAVIAGSHLEVFERSGHFPHLDEPRRFARVVRDFLARTHDRQPEH